jgi:argininosuccinate lyase
MRGLDRTAAMLAAVAHALPKLEVDSKRCESALGGGALATDEVMKRVEQGQSFRSAYHDVAAGLRDGDSFDRPTPDLIISRRSSAGGLGNLGLPELKKRMRSALSWNAREQKRFQGAMTRLAGKAVPLPRRPAAPLP